MTPEFDVFSRWMPPYVAPQPSRKQRAIGLAVLTVIGGTLLVFLALYPIALAGTATLIAVIWIVSLLQDRRLARKVRARSAESICTFVRGLDRRTAPLDPWIVRAVWDALAPWTIASGGVRLPLRATDVIADLGCVDEDLEDVYVQAATRADRQIRDTKENPYYGCVQTVGDLVRFIAHQPRTPAA
jgi:hypothetical protein